MKKEKRFIPELLAPAGNKEAFIAAVEAGADAIYLGGEILNARMGAGNFSLQEMKAAIDFAHKRHVKVYVTVNTLVMDEELEDALVYCKKLYEMGADALIIQDLGLGFLIKEKMPDFPIHLSTQGSVYDLDGVNAAGKLGYERVVLARELSLKEIKDICKNTDVEIEVFCHGALCICYSGQCQMSRAIGLRSGNRGACAQPCRLLYELKSNGRWLEKNHYLSPADFNLLDYIGELSDAGVASIKIEGRMKSPEYVGVVTSIYRKYLDQYRDKGDYSVAEEDRVALMQIFNRGFTNGYLEGEDPDLMSGDKPKHKGIYVGEVLSVEEIRGKESRSIVKIESNIELHREDVLEIGEGSHATITLLEGRRPTFRVGDVIGNVKPGDAVYRMVSAEQIKTAECFYKNKDWNQGKFIRRTPLQADVISGSDASIKIILRDIQAGKTVEVKAEELDRSDSVDAANRIEESLKKTGGTPFLINKINLRGDFNYSISVSQINELRRQAINLMEEELASNNRNNNGSKGEFELNKKSEDCAGDESRDLELFFYEVKDFLLREDLSEVIEKSGAKIKSIFILLPATEMIKCIGEAKEKANRINAKIIPYISNISKGEENIIVAENFDTICDMAKDTGIYLGNLNWIEKFKNAGIKVFADYGLNRFNYWTEVALSNIGASYVSESLECMDVGSGFYGRAPLMTSQHDFSGEGLRDRVGQEYDVLDREFSDQEIIVLAEEKSLSDALGWQAKNNGKKIRRLRVYI